MMDCKNALEEAGGDMDKAGEILRKKGVVKAAKRADKIAAEGVVLVKTQGNIAVVAEVNSETDFVANSDDFKALAESLVSDLLEKKPADLDAALSSGISDKLSAMTGKIGEKIVLRRFVLVEKSADEVFGDYIHMGGKIAVLTLLSGTSDAGLAKDVAMHVAASNPKFLNRSEVPTEALDKEKEIFIEQLKTQNKPANIIENIVKGKLEKFYSENCLTEQAFIKDEDKTVATYVGSGVTIKKFVRLELGEGIEKKEKNFADEVAEQLG